MELRKINSEDARSQWEYTTELPADENGLTNPYHGVSYDEYIAKETEREILAERVERRKRQMEMLNGFDELVAQRIKTLKPDDLNADGAMDLLERSAKLDSFITGADKEKEKPVQGELAITFADSFQGL